jgi:predicted nucleic acid-binding protein
MCIIVDPPLFVALFKKSDTRHETFSPVLQWVKDGKGKFVVGGSLYQSELGKVGTVLKPIQELEKKGKVVRRDKKKVDIQVEIVKTQEKSKDFDDPHLVALVLESGCRLVCTSDDRAHKYLKDEKFFKKNNSVPSLFTNASHKHLLCKSNIVNCCQ